jgi:hypothetical protein
MEVKNVEEELLKQVESKDRKGWFKTWERCFIGSQAVDWVCSKFHCSRVEAIKHLEYLRCCGVLHHVNLRLKFSDSSEYYGFSELHFPKDAECSDCLNVFDNSFLKGDTSKSIEIAEELNSIVSEVLSVFLDENRKRFNYHRFKESELFERYLSIAKQLQILDLSLLSEDLKLTFYINLYNIMCIHGILSIPRPESDLGRLSWFSNIKYLIGGFQYSLMDVEHGLIRSNTRGPYLMSVQFKGDDPRCEYIMAKIDPRIHFALVCAALSCPSLTSFE